jgi:hypothetical protein
MADSTFDGAIILQLSGLALVFRLALHKQLLLESKNLDGFGEFPGPNFTRDDQPVSGITRYRAA